MDYAADGGRTKVRPYGVVDGWKFGSHSDEGDSVGYGVGHNVGWINYGNIQQPLCFPMPSKPPCASRAELPGQWCL